MGSVLVRVNERTAIRRSVDVACSVVRQRDGKVIGRKAFDLSPWGMRVALSDAEVDPGDLLYVYFKATPQDLLFCTDATATRLLAGRRPKERGRSLGLRFDTLDSVSRLILRGALRRVPPPLPQREPRIDYAATIANILSS